MLPKKILSATAVLLILTAGCGTVAISSLHSPSGEDQFFDRAAQDLAAPSLCDKISSKAYDTNSNAPKGYQIEYTASRCIMSIAVKSKDASLCADIQTISGHNLDGSKISEKQCNADIKSGNLQAEAFPAPAEQDYKNAMDALGYTPDKILDIEYTTNAAADPAVIFYNSARKTSTFIQNINKLPDYTEPYNESKARQANSDEIITQMVAIDNALPELCNKISPNAYVLSTGSTLSASNPSTDQAQTPVAVTTDKNPLQNACFASTAPHSAVVNYYIFPERAAFIAELKKLGYAQDFDKNAVINYTQFYTNFIILSTPDALSDFEKKIQALPSSP